MLELQEGVLRADAYLAVTLGIIVLFSGKRLNEAIPFLRDFSIPQPVTGGLLFAMLFTFVYVTTGVEVEFDMEARDLLLVYFFTTIGINASFRDLLAGGKPLLILLAITIGYMVIQNLTAIGVASLFGGSTAEGLLGGTISLIGGHGTAIAWAPQLESQHGVRGAMEIGIACATFGLILASLMGGPVAKYLIARHKLEPESGEIPDVGIDESNRTTKISAVEFLDAILAIHLSAICGLLINHGLSVAGLQLPLFVTCLFAGILITNLTPHNFMQLSGHPWPSRTASMALIAEVSLGTFLAMSLMSMQLWTLVDAAGPIAALMFLQFVIAIVIILFIVFPVMGRDYNAAVVCAGFGGISLGSTPTAMANMAAVTSRYGASHMAFIVVPLVCAFFIDIVNALLIPYMLANF